MFKHRKGFTLIELLVVVAVIGILAAILFPVFARARDAARKAVCLNNIKNIALGFNMYTTEWDDMAPPGENRREAIDLYTESGVWGWCAGSIPTAWASRHMNPWLRWPVILEPYIKNRDMWKCAVMPALVGGARMIIPTDNYDDFLDYYRDTMGIWGTFASGATWPNLICQETWPQGWGGSITDSLRQGAMAVSGQSSGAAGTAGQVYHEAFVTGYTYNEGNLTGMSMAKLEDPAWTFLLSDGVYKGYVCPENYALTDLCFAGCGNCMADIDMMYYQWGVRGADWANCSWSSECGVDGLALLGEKDVTGWMIEHGTRHLNGSNLGFVDGHAKWFPARSLLSMSPRTQNGGWYGAPSGPGVIVMGKLKAVNIWQGTTAAGNPELGIEPGYVPCDAKPMY